MQRFIEHEGYVEVEEIINGEWKSIGQLPYVSEKQKQRNAVKKHYYNNREVILKKQKERHHEKYGLTKEQYEKMKKEQNGRCAICGKEKKLVIDHDHRTGKVRKLLCNQCNVGIGLLQDSPNILEIAKKYISDFLS